MHSWYHIKWITFLTPKTSTSRSVSHIFTHNLLVCYDWWRRLRPFVMRLPLHTYFLALIETYWHTYGPNTISYHRKTIDICVFVLLFWLPFESFYSPIVVSEFIKIQIQRPSEKYFAYLYKIRRVRYETECKIPVVQGNVELRCKKHNKVMVRSIPPPLSLTPWQIIPSRCLGLIPSESYVQLHAPVECMV